MPKSFTGNALKDVYKDILHTNNSNTGLSTTIKQVTCGDGDNTSLYLSNRNAKYNLLQILQQIQLYMMQMEMLCLL